MKFTLCFLIAVGFVQNTLAESVHIISPDKPAENKKSPPTIKFVELASLVKENSLQIKSEQMNVSVNESRTGHLARSFLPQISGTVGSESLKTAAPTTQNNGFWSLGASLNIYNGGRDQIEDEVRKRDLEIAKGEQNISFAVGLRESQIAYWEIVAFPATIFAPVGSAFESTSTCSFPSASSNGT